MNESQIGSIPLAQSNLQQQALECWRQEEYGTAAVLFEQLIEQDPATVTPYWYLGLARLLQGHETEAQLTWTVAMSEGEAETVEQWTADLLQILTTEAARQQAIGQPKMAWAIRQHIREIDPTNLKNLLEGLQLSIELGQFQGAELTESGLIERIEAEPLAEDDAERLESLIDQLLEVAIEDPTVADLVTAFVPRTADPAHWITPLLETANRLSTTLFNYHIAIRYAELCLAIDSHHSETLMRLAGYCQDTGRYEEGLAFAERYLAGCQTTIQRVLGTSVRLRGLMIQGGNWQEAIATLDRLTALQQTLLTEYQITGESFLDASIICSPLFFYPYIADRARKTRSLQNQVASLYQADLHAFVEKNVDDYRPYPQAPLVRPPERKKIRIGYLSRCMRMHSVGWLSRWLFHHYDRDRFEVHALFNQHVRVDGFTRQWFADKATSACCIEGDILGIAKSVREAEIDILVDLDSITSDLTCGVMALKPAPVQVTWLGLDATGLPAIDYFIADPYVLPDDAEDYYAETIWRLPQTYIAVDGFEVGTPTLRRDQLNIPTDAVIYFSAQISCKRNPDTIRQQMQILRQVPNSYFLVKGLGDTKAIQSLFTQLAEQEGVGGDRLRFLPRDDNELTHRANLGIADVVLDTFPYNGATTTLETLWMGIPLVTRVGQQFASRNSYTMMRNAGISEGIAYTAEDYVAWGVRLGQDAALRQQIHWKLLRSRQTSPLWNARQFTREMERAYEGMWERMKDEG